MGPSLTIDSFNREKEVIFALGGFKGSIDGNLRKFVLPKDFCNLFQSEPHRCKTSLGCAHCSVFDDVNGQNATFCYSNALSKPSTCTSFQSGMYKSSIFHFSKASFSKASISTASFSKASFSKESFLKASLSKASFSKASFSKASFSKESFLNVSFSNASF
jgi:uncharacterized protein YjbI with pentapeptide repeats